MRRLDRPLTRKLSRLVTLSPAETAVLRELQSHGRRITRGREMVVEGRKYDELLILLDGVALRYRVLNDGRRQVLNIVLPGDLIGFPGCFFEGALYSISALGDCVVSPVPFTRFLRLPETHPRLGAAIFWSLSCETAIYAEHLIGVGRRSASGEVGRRILLEMLTQLQAIGFTDEPSYRLPLTQELIADALGLSVQYVNQTLRQLREEGRCRRAPGGDDPQYRCPRRARRFRAQLHQPLPLRRTRRGELAERLAGRIDSTRRFKTVGADGG